MSGRTLDVDALYISEPSTDEERRRVAHARRKASLTLAEAVLADPTIRGRAHQRGELRTWLDMFGLPPSERPMRTAKKIK